MIVANLATYPARSGLLVPVVASICSQVDRLNVVLNEYTAIPEDFNQFDNVKAIIPDHDTKDTGKFYPDTTGAEYVILVDDDIVYPPDFVALTLERVRQTGLKRVFAGYHTSVYQRPRLGLRPAYIRSFVRFHLSPRLIARYRKISYFPHGTDRAIYVDQIGTGAAVISGQDMPPYAYMKTSQKFVDVRMAKWCFERGIPRVGLPREDGWLGANETEESIFGDFTLHHPRNVADEIWAFAFKDSRSGTAVLATE